MVVSAVNVPPARPGARAPREVAAPRLLQAPARPVTFAAYIAEPPRPARVVTTTSFIGREREVAELRLLLADCRLLTLTGSGGIGKSRLATQLVAGGARDETCRRLDLTDVTDPALLAGSVATALGVTAAGRAPLRDALAAIGTRPMVLLLDNCDRLGAAAATLAADLLAACPHLRLLATSRVPLAVPGEVTWSVPPLALSEREAIRLFVERATAASPAFVAGAGECEAIAWICRRLGGVPLTIELVAARVRALDPGQPIARLAEDDGTPSLSATIAASEAELTPGARDLLRRLATFPASFSAEAARFVGRDDAAADDAVAAALDALVAAALVGVHEVDGARRLSLPEPVRADALDRLRATPALEERARDRQAAFILGQAEATGAAMHGPERGAWTSRLALDAATIRTALAWCLGAKQPARLATGRRLAAALWWWWFHRGDWNEGRRWLDRALGRGGERGEMAGALDPVLLSARTGAGWLAYAQGEPEIARRHLETSAAGYRRLRDNHGLALASAFLSQVLLSQGDPAEARRLAGESVALARTIAGPWLPGFARLCLGDVERARGNDQAAARLYEESIAAARTAGDRWLEALGLRSLGIVSARTGRHTRGIALLRESLRRSRDESERWFITRGLEELAGLTVRAGDPIRAARLLGAADGVRIRAGGAVASPSADRVGSTVAAVRRALSPATLAACWGEGRALSLDAAVALALGEEVPAAVSGERTGEREVAPSAPLAVGPALVIVSGEEREVERASGGAPLRVSAFGGGRVEIGGRSVSTADWTYAKPRELLYYLLDHPARSKEQVGKALWPEASRGQLRGSFHVALHHLRRVLGDADWIRYADRRYAVNRERAIWYDVAIFEAELAAARRATGAPDQAIVALEAALAIYGGDFLDGTESAWARERRDGLRRDFADAALLLGELRLSRNETREAATAFRRLLAVDGLNERAHRGLIRALARGGKPAQALRHYEHLTTLLRSRLGIAPAAETTDLVARLRRGGAI